MGVAFLPHPFFPLILHFHAANLGLLFEFDLARREHFYECSFSEHQTNKRDYLRNVGRCGTRATPITHHQSSLRRLSLLLQIIRRLLIDRDRNPSSGLYIISRLFGHRPQSGIVE